MREQNVLAKEDIAVLFGNVEALLQINTSMLAVRTPSAYTHTLGCDLTFVEYRLCKRKYASTNQTLLCIILGVFCWTSFSR